MRADPSRRPVPHPVSVRPPKRCSSRTADEARTLQDETIHVQEMVSRLCSTVAIVVSWLLIICCFPWSLLVVVKVVYEYERVVVLRLGRLVRKQPLAAGLHVIIPCLDSVRKVDMRVRSFSLPLSDLVTVDSTMIRVDAIVYYRVQDPVLVTTSVEDAEKSTREASVTVCRNAIVRKPLNEILVERQEVCNEIQDELSRATAEWGIAIQRVELTDVQLSEELHRALTLEKEARQNARVKLIAAEGEAEIANALTTAAAKLASAPMALQLRYLQTLQSLTSCSKNSINTVLVPLPIELTKTTSTSGPMQMQMQMHMQHQQHSYAVRIPTPANSHAAVQPAADAEPEAEPEPDLEPDADADELAFRTGTDRSPSLAASGTDAHSGMQIGSTKTPTSSTSELIAMASNTRVYADRPPRP